MLERQKTSIKDFYIPSSNIKDLAFDPLNYVTPTYLLKLQEKLENYISESEDKFLIENVCNELIVLKFIPFLKNTAPLFDLHSEVLTDYTIRGKREKSSFMIQPGITLKCLDPLAFASIGLSKSEWNWLKEWVDPQIDFLNSATMNEEYVRGKIWGMSTNLRNLNLLFPQFQERINLNENSLKLMVEGCFDYREQGWNFAKIAANIKVLFPERFAEIGFNRNDWKDAKEFQENNRNDREYASLFAEGVFDLLIIHAKDVLATPNKIDLVLPSRFEYTTPNFPERRTF